MHRLTVLLLSLTGRYEFHNGTALQRPPPKKACPTGKKANLHGSSFSYKVRCARTAIEILRDRRPARRMGSTVVLEYQSQGCWRRVKNEACLEKLAGDIQGRGKRVERNPHGGRQRAAGLYRTRLVTPTALAPLFFRTPPGCS